MYYGAALGFFRNTSNVTIRAALSKLASNSTRKNPIDKTSSREDPTEETSTSKSNQSNLPDIIWWSSTEPAYAPMHPAIKTTPKPPGSRNLKPPNSPQKPTTEKKQTTGSLFSLLAFIEAIVPLASSPIVAWLYTTSLSWY